VKIKIVSILILTFSTLLLGSFVSPAYAVTFFGPTNPYLSTADSPFFASGGPGAGLCSVEDFEDGSLDFGIVASLGTVKFPSVSTDSVDFDDGVIDGSGQLGHSYLATFGAGGTVTFTFPAPVTHAGYVWTDGNFQEMTTFEAFGPGMFSLGMFGPFTVGDAVFNGETAEDTFFGASDPNGIIAISITQVLNGLELDHIQFCNAPLQPPQRVGGEYFTLDTTSLLLTGIQTNLAWLVPVALSVAAICTIFVKRKF